MMPLAPMDQQQRRAKLVATVLKLMDEENARQVVADSRNRDYSRLGDEALPVERSRDGKSTSTYQHAKVDACLFDTLEHEWYYGPNFLQQFESMCRSCGERRALGYRPVIRVSQEFVKEPESGLERKFDVTFYDKTLYLSYESVWSTLVNFGRGLSELLMPESCEIGMYLETRWEWLVSAYGVWSQGMVLATMSADLGEEALSQAFAETSCAAIVTSGERVPSLIAMMERGAIPFAVIVYLDQLPGGTHCPDGVILKSWEDVVSGGVVSDKPIQIPTDPDALALIMYAPRADGKPRGVMHSYGSITCGARGLGEKWREVLGPRHADESYVASRPLSDISEFAMCVLSLKRGCWIGFGHPRTLMGLYANPHGDLEEFKPSLLVGTPDNFDLLKKAMEASLAPHGSLERLIFEHAFASRLRYLQAGMDTPFWNRVVFAPLQQQLGGRVRVMCSTSGPVSCETQRFLKAVVGGFIQGYGLPETLGNGAKQVMGDEEELCVGQPERCVKFKLVDTPDYKHTDLPEPRGEVCLRGPMLFKGYYKKESVTKAAIDEDGWFHTGDVGSIADRGRLRIVSRIKSIE